MDKKELLINSLFSVLLQELIQLKVEVTKAPTDKVKADFARSLETKFLQFDPNINKEELRLYLYEVFFEEL